jgi:prefoldin subunit 5
VRAEAEKALKEIEENKNKLKKKKEQAGRNIKNIKSSK